MVEQFVQAVADHQRNLVSGEVAFVEGADAFEDG
jgi:hypothetical protein